jgi:hypothetical protein
MFKAYEYLFYRYHQWSIKVNGKVGYHKLSACMMMTGAIYLCGLGFGVLYAGMFEIDSISIVLPLT